MIETLLKTVLGSTTSLGISGGSVYTSVLGNDNNSLEDSLITTSMIGSALAAFHFESQLEQMKEDGTLAVNYVETCTDEEINDLVSQIDLALEQDNAKVRTLRK